MQNGLHNKLQWLVRNLLDSHHSLQQQQGSRGEEEEEEVTGKDGDGDGGSTKYMRTLQQVVLPAIAQHPSAQGLLGDIQVAMQLN
jgi:hypothetical protein